MGENRFKEVPVEIPKDAFGYPGARGILVAETTETPGPVKKFVRTDDKTRFYEVRVFLGRDLQITSVDFSNNGGDSYFVGIPQGKIRMMEANLPPIEAEVQKNSAGRMSKIVINALDANNPVEALAKAKRYVYPFLSILSYAGDVPLVPDRIQVVDLKTAQLAFEFSSPYQDKDISAFNFGIHALLKPIYALYREAKNSSSYVYRFLCYVKIMEGMYRSIRKKTNSLAEKAGVPLDTFRQNEIVPASGDFVIDEQIGKSIIGKKIGNIFHSVLQPKYRDAIAHFELDGSAPIDFDDPSFPADLESYIPFIERMARTLIDNEYLLLEAVAKKMNGIP